MADSGRVHPDCVNAANPYHECGVACLEKIAQGQTKTSLEKKKKSGSFILDGSLSFGRKKKGSESRPQSPQPQVVKKDAVVKPAYADNTPSARYARKKIESENSQSFSSSQQNSDESYSRDTSSEKEKVRSSDSLPTSENMTPDTPKGQSKGKKFNGFAVDVPAKLEDSPKMQGSPRPASNGVTKNVAVMTSGPLYGPLDFVFSGISRASEDSDDDEIQSVAESCVSVGKYRVSASIVSVLELIFAKYGDIAANCRLESASMRSYYLECLCNVVQELRSTSVKQLTNLKLKEMVAVVKDVESVRIDVSWLSSVLNELIEGMELENQQQAAKEQKANYDQGVETTRKELESMMEELAQKEEEVADIKSRVEEARQRLSKLELESSQLRETISSINSKVEKFHLKPLVDDIL